MPMVEGHVPRGDFHLKDANEWILKHYVMSRLFLSFDYLIG
jgi:hypothetical protein